MNMYFVFDDGRIVTPATGTILEGITRGSIIELAGKMGHQVEERKFSIDEWRDGVDQRRDHRDLRLRHRRRRHPGRRAQVGRRLGRRRRASTELTFADPRRRWSTSSSAAPRTPSAGCTGSCNGRARERPRMVVQPPASTPYDPLDRIAREPDALEAFYRDHVEAVQRFVARRVSDPHLAADLTADVFLAAVDSAASYDAQPGPGGRLALRRGPQRHRRRGAAPGPRAARRTPDRGAPSRRRRRPGPDRGAPRRRARVAPAATGRSPSSRRTTAPCWSWSSLDGLSIADAARVLGVKPATARVRLHRSRARVTARLHETGATRAP